MIENFDVVDLFARRHIAFLGMARVVETGIIFFPRHAGEASALDSIGQHFAAGSFDEMQSAFFRAAGRSAVCHILAVFRRKPPVQCNRTVSRHLISVYQRAICATDAFPHIEDRLVLHPLAPRIEVVLTPKLRRTDGANRQQL